MLCKFRQKQLFSIRLFHLHCGNYMITGGIYVILSYVYLFIIMFTTISALQWMSRCYCARGVPCMIQEILLHSKYCIWFHSHLPCELVLFFYKSRELSYYSLLFVRLSRLWFICTPLLGISIFILLCESKTYINWRDHGYINNRCTFLQLLWYQ